MDQITVASRGIRLVLILKILLFYIGVINGQTIDYQGFEFIESRKEIAVERLIKIGSIISPSGAEEQRAEAVASLMNEIGLAFISIESIYNVVGLIPGKSDSCLIFVSTLDDLASVAKNQSLESMSLKAIDNRVVGPGSNTSTTTISMLQAAEAILSLDIRPNYTLVFAGVSQEETGLIGMRKVFNDWQDRTVGFIDILGDGSEITYGAICIHWWKIIGYGPAGHTLNGGLPNVNQGLARAIERIFDIEILEAERKESTVLNISIIESGEVFNHKPHSGWFSVDIRSLETGNIHFIEDQINIILEEVNLETGIDFMMEPFHMIPGGQITGALQSNLVQTVELAIQTVGITPKFSKKGSSNMNIPISRNHIAVGLNGERGGLRGEKDEWADIDAMMRTTKVVFMIATRMGY